ncbi:hypothetical protein [Dactylosporangium sp. CA-139066]|uniref:hypothetical protein n=1 Tax=Dactylosporangium sp. CA-139066 TaxID=3239930 RepID=UPI003D91B209
MGQWVVVVSGEQYESERLYGGEALTVADGGFGAGDEVLLVAAVEPAVVFGVGRAESGERLRYTVNLLDSPLAAEGLPVEVGVWGVDEEAYRAVARRAVVEPEERRTWLVSVDMPIEASSPGDAVRAFWSYVRELGPAELPAFVWPAGNELAMQAYVLGAEANQDPEEE